MASNTSPILFLSKKSGKFIDSPGVTSLESNCGLVLGPHNEGIFIVYLFPGKECHSTPSLPTQPYTPIQVYSPIFHSQSCTTNPAHPTLHTQLCTWLTHSILRTASTVHVSPGKYTKTLQQTPTEGMPAGTCSISQSLAISARNVSCSVL